MDGGIEILTGEGTGIDQADRKVEASKRITTPIMTKYERARVIGTRALQIALVIQKFFVESFYFSFLICFSIIIILRF